MELQVGDRVRSAEGDLGTVVIVDRLTAYITTDSLDEHKTLRGFLASSLTRIEESAARSVAAEV